MNMAVFVVATVLGAVLGTLVLGALVECLLRVKRLSATVDIDRARFESLEAFLTNQRARDSERIKKLEAKIDAAAKAMGGDL